MDSFLYERDLRHERFDIILENIILLETNGKLSSEATIEKVLVNSNPFQS